MRFSLSFCLACASKQKPAQNITPHPAGLNGYGNSSIYGGKRQGGHSKKNIQPHNFSKYLY
jgi:hypothetical protein